MFLAAMRHFALALQAAGRPLHYTRLDAPGNAGSLAAQLQADIQRLRPARLVMTAPGDWRVLQAIKAVAEAAGLPLDIREDRHFFVTVREFAAHAQGRKSLRLEYFYREQRERHERADGRRPAGGRPVELRRRQPRGLRRRGARRGAGTRSASSPTPITREVHRAGRHALRATTPAGSTASPGRSRARRRCSRCRPSSGERLPLFGRYQDAMWPGDPWLYHSHLSAALNLKLLNPREVVAAAEAAYRDGQAPLASVEGFIRQILGWREYVRGIYWTQMPGYLERNALDAQEDLPAWYWTGDTDMACLRDALTQTLTHGYANHIQRLMVTGLYALMLGVDPKQVHAWYLAVYVDAVEWVELPNTLGMSQYADGGLMGSKPYVATGKYIQRMSPHCQGCRYDPAQRSGDERLPVHHAVLGLPDAA